MKLSIVCFMFVAYFALANGQSCSVPPQWQAKIHERDEKLSYRATADISYDEANKRIRLVGSQKYGANEDITDRIYLFNEGVQYVYSFTTKLCTKSPLYSGFLSLSPPKDAQFYSNIYAGSAQVENGNLSVSSYFGITADSRGEKYDFAATYTTNGCIPVNILAENNQNSYHAYFYNVSVGISENAFALRQECVGL